MNQRKTSERIRPVLFNTEMVRALLEGRKTVTRRVVKPQPQESETNPHRLTSGCYYFDVPSKRFPGDLDRIVGPYWPPYQPGDILWVRETWAHPSKEEIARGTDKNIFLYRADVPSVPYAWDHWNPSIHMPREAARIFLRVTGVRVERLRDINLDPPGPKNQVVREGLNYLCDFIAVWERTIKPADRSTYGWGANPWVWVIQFEHCEKPSGFGEGRK